MRTETKIQKGAFVLKNGIRIEANYNIVETYHDDGRKDVCIQIPELKIQGENNG